MPLIPPKFSNVSAPQNKPPWARGSASINQQTNDGPAWKRNLKSEPPPQDASNAVTVPKTVTPTPTPVQVQPLASQVPLPETPKTSKLQINLKSVKKPSAPDSPQLQPPPIVHQPKISSAHSKAVPIPILVQKEENNPSTPNQRHDAPVIKTESKVKFKVPSEKSKPLQPASVVEAEPKMPQSSDPVPPAPPPPPVAPPPPPPPAGELTAKQVKVEQLRKSSRKRPDWAGMMREIEKRKALNHVVCDDRSKPMLSRMKSRGKFVYESEAKPATKKDALHNRILNEITQGVKLKKVVCNDRSKPVLTGLRMARQLSAQEGEGQKEGAPAALDPVEELVFFDIDVLRDELQSAKQLLQAEVEAKQNLEKQNRDQKCHIIAMEAELEELQAKLRLLPEEQASQLAKGLEKSDSKTLKILRKSGSALWKSPSSIGLKKSRSGLTKEGTPLTKDSTLSKIDQAEEDLPEMNELEEEIVSLKEIVQHSKKQTDEIELKYKDTMEKLSLIQKNFEEAEEKRLSAERKLKGLEALTDGRPLPAIIQTAERTTQTDEQMFEEKNQSEDESEDERSYVEVDDADVQKKKQERELILWENKLKSIRDKQASSRTERRNLKSLQKKLELELKEANKQHKKLQKEVNSMANLMKDMELDDDEDEDEEEEVEPKKVAPTTEEDETDEEEESEEEESESDEDDQSSEEDDDKAPHDDRLAVYGKRGKRRENVLNALRKGNYLLRANIDRLKDDLEDARIAYHDLEHELKSVLED